MPKFLTKGDYILGLECPAVLWTKKNAPDRLPENTEFDLYRMHQGIDAGKLAQSWWPDGVEIEHTGNWSDMVAKTKALILARKITFEATFIVGRLMCKVDALIPVGKDDWELVEVKSSNSVKDEHQDDVAFQKYVLEKAGLQVSRAHLMHLNREYVREGDLDLKSLFIMENLTDNLSDASDAVEENVRELLAVIDAPKPPEPKLGERCASPIDCPVCCARVEGKEIVDLYYNKRKAYGLLEHGITKFSEVDKEELNDKQRVQQIAIATKMPQVDKDKLAKWLSKLVYPLYFFDFETYSTAVPGLDGLRPWQQVPFQFSLHIRKSPDAEMEHFEFLAETGPGAPMDPRDALMAALNKIGDEGSILAHHSSFEKRILDELSQRFPDESKWLHERMGRLADLEEPFKNFWYYHPEQHGSTSIKMILPALVGKSYEGMEIGAGDDASLAFIHLREGIIAGEEANKLRQSLLVYCKQDTQSMVDILEVLENAAK